MTTTSPITCSRVELARILGVNESTLHRWSNQGMPGVSSRGRNGSSYDPAAVIAWCRATGKFAPAVTDGDSLDKDREQALFTREKRMREEMENAVRRGELVEARDVERAWADVLLACRAKLLGLPTKAARQVLGLRTEREISAVLTATVQEALRELAGGDHGTIESGDTGDSAALVGVADASPGADCEPVGRRKPQAQQRGKRGAWRVGDG